MKKTKLEVFLTDERRNYLREEAARLQITVAELIRRWIDEKMGNAK